MSNLSVKEIDRRLIFVLVGIALSLPLLLKYSVPPARMAAAEKLYQTIEKIEPAPGKVAFISMDFGPNTIAENGAQAEVVIEHLMRRRIPIMMFSLYPFAASYLDSYPERVASRLMQEFSGERWEYGRDWINLGYRPGGDLLLQSLPQSDDLLGLFVRDARGASLKDLQATKGVRTVKDVIFLGQFTGLVGTLDSYLQFFKSKDYQPVFGHGCTSITVPEGYIYLDSGQLHGLLEGIAGAAWYSNLLSTAHPARAKDTSELINTGLGIAHLVIILLVVIGNAESLYRYRSGRRK